MDPGPISHPLTQSQVPKRAVYDKTILKNQHIIMLYKLSLFITSILGAYKLIIVVNRTAYLDFVGYNGHIPSPPIPLRLTALCGCKHATDLDGDHLVP